MRMVEIIRTENWTKSAPLEGVVVVEVVVVVVVVAFGLFSSLLLQLKQYI